MMDYESVTNRTKDGILRDASYNKGPVTEVIDGLHRTSQGEEDNYQSISGSYESSVDEEEFGMSIQELLYSSSSYYAIAKPVTITMVLAALAVVFINTDATREAGKEAMATAYQVWNVDDSSMNKGETLALSLANAFVMICVIGLMTFLVVFLYRMRFMKCLIGYMVLGSTSLLGLLGSNLLRTALQIYEIPVDIISFCLFMFNFAAVGVLAVFWGKGIPRVVTQGYLVATSVILAWHLSFFDDWTAWCLLFMLALYDLCAVLSSVGPLKALVEAMSEEDAPEMPGLLFEAQLPPEAKKPGVPRVTPNSVNNVTEPNNLTSSNPNQVRPGAQEPDVHSGIGDDRTANEENGRINAQTMDKNQNADPIVSLPLAIAQVYRLPIVSIPPESRDILFPRDSTANGAEPLLMSQDGNAITVPENPTVAQLRADVTVRMPSNGGRLERVKKRGKRVFLERDRHGNPKRILWVDRNGKVFAEMRDDDEDDPNSSSSIRLGLGDFIFYSVLVSKAAQYSFATFAACMLVILAGLGGTLLLLAIYHQALPALPISILLGIFFYLVTRALIEPWIEAVLRQPYYV